MRVHRDLAELVAQAAAEPSHLRSGLAGAVQPLLRERLHQARGGHRMKDEDRRTKRRWPAPVVGRVDFHAVIQMHRALAVLVVAEGRRFSWARSG